MKEEWCGGCEWLAAPLTLTKVLVCEACLLDKKFEKGMQENHNTLCNRLHKIDKAETVVVPSVQEVTPDGEENAGSREDPA